MSAAAQMEWCSHSSTMPYLSSRAASPFCRVFAAPDRSVWLAAHVLLFTGSFDTLIPLLSMSCHALRNLQIPAPGVARAARPPSARPSRGRRHLQGWAPAVHSAAGSPAQLQRQLCIAEERCCSSFGRLRWWSAGDVGARRKAANSRLEGRQSACHYACIPYLGCQMQQPASCPPAAYQSAAVWCPCCCRRIMAGGTVGRASRCLAPEQNPGIREVISACSTVRKFQSKHEQLPGKLIM